MNKSLQDKIEGMIIKYFGVETGLKIMNRQDMINISTIITAEIEKDYIRRDSIEIDEEKIFEILKANCTNQSNKFLKEIVAKALSSADIIKEK